MSTSNYEKVKQFNQSFGVPIPDAPRPHLFDEEPKTVQLKLDLILEEVQELRDACEQKDPVEVLDALADILYVVYGAGISFGFNMDEAFDRVHRSNMSKLCDTEDQARATVEVYNKNDQKYDSPVYRVDESTGKYVIYNKSTGKILKNKDYEQVKLKDLVFPKKVIS